MNIFTYSKNTKYEKDMTNEIFKRLIYKKKIKDRLFLINKEISFFNDAIQLLNENKFFSYKNKKYLKYFTIHFQKIISK